MPARIMRFKLANLSPPHMTACSSRTDAGVGAVEEQAQNKDHGHAAGGGHQPEG
jgi:hypothetical protein